jgi:hypothetical protein
MFAASGDVCGSRLLDTRPLRATQRFEKTRVLLRTVESGSPPDGNPGRYIYCALRGLSFQLRGHGMARATLAASRVILVEDTTLRCLVESRSKYIQLGFDFALISSGNRRIQLFLLRFDSGEY